MQKLFARLKLRENWPLGLIVPILLILLKVYVARPYISSVYQTSPSAVVDYQALIFNYSGFPIELVFLVFFIAIIAVIALLAKASRLKTLVALISMFMCFTLSGACVLVTSRDGTTFTHLETVEFETGTYHLTRARTFESGLMWDGFWVIACDKDYIDCHYNDVQHEKHFPLIGGDVPVPDGKLIVDKTTNALYLQIGDEKTLVVQ